MVIDPINGVLRDSSLRATICTCPDCGEIFMKAESLELHQSVSHAGEIHSLCPCLQIFAFFPVKFIDNFCCFFELLLSKTQHM